MRKASEQKTRSTSIRMTNDQYAIIEQRAKEQGVSVSAYLVNAAVHPAASLTPGIMAKVQTLVNDACDACRCSNPKEAERLAKEANELWSF